MICLHICWGILWFDGWERPKTWLGVVKIATTLFTHMLVSCLVSEWVSEWGGVHTILDIVWWEIFTNTNFVNSDQCQTKFFISHTCNNSCGCQRIHMWTHFCGYNFSWVTVQRRQKNSCYDIADHMTYSQSRTAKVFRCSILPTLVHNNWILHALPRVGASN